MRKRKFEKRKRLLQEQKRFSIKVGNVTYDFVYETKVRDELYIDKNNKLYQVANWEELIFAFICGYTYVQAYILNPDEEIPGILTLNFFKILDKPW